MIDNNPFDVPEDITDYSHDEAYQRGVYAGIDHQSEKITKLESKLATARAVALSAEATTRVYRSEIVNLRRLCGDAADALEPFIFPVRKPDPRDYR